MATVATTRFADLEAKKNQLIRKTLAGAAFVAETTADPIGDLTLMTGASDVPPSTIVPVPLPEGYEDMGNLTTDGMSFARSVSQSEITSLGSTTPTRTDITADTGTMVVVAQETKLLTIGIATGATLAALKDAADATTGEVKLIKPDRPAARHWRVLSVSLDNGDGGEIYIGRWMPYAKVTDYAEQAYAGGDTTTNWGVTFTAEKDPTLGFAESWLFGGAGWFALLEDMGFTTG